LNDSGTSYLVTRADDSASDVDFAYPAAVPYSYTSTSVDGGASSESEYNFSNLGFDITLDHSRVSGDGGISRSYGSIYFSVDNDVDFTALGSYSVVDPDGRRAHVYAYLYDQTSDSYLFQSLQQSDATPNESFTLGGTGGDFNNLQLGSLTGTLIAGHDYNLYYNAYIQALPSTTSGATASGSFSLVFPAPEPGTGLLLGMGLLALTAGRRRSRESRWRAVSRSSG
jgi:hypothetical protein